MTDAPRFHGFGPAAFTWLDGLAADNSRSYVAAHGDAYETELRAPLAALLDDLAAGSGGRPRLLRQLRDLRFAANRERPYWPTVAGELTGIDESCAVLRIALGADGLVVQAGCRRFASDQLARFRAAAAAPDAGAELADALAIVEVCGMSVDGPTLRGLPRGVPRDHPRAGLLRYTGLAAGSVLAPRRRRRGTSAGPAIAPRAAFEHAEETWRAAEPLIAWIDAHVGPAGGAPLAAAA